MGKQGLPGEIASQDMMDFLVYRGWRHDRNAGDHRIYVKQGERSIPVPHPEKLNTRRKGLFYDILREMGSNKKGFAEWYNATRC